MFHVKREQVSPLVAQNKRHERDKTDEVERHMHSQNCGKLVGTIVDDAFVERKDKNGNGRDDRAGEHLLAEMANAKDERRPERQQPNPLTPAKDKGEKVSVGGQPEIGESGARFFNQ